MLTNLQVLRAFAAINVVYFHTIIASISYQQQVNHLILLKGWGINGVDIFFVISGFVMVYTQKNNPKRAGNFLLNRIIRIVPLYWGLTLLLLGIYFLLPNLFRQYEPTAWHTLSSFLFISKAAAEKLPILTIGWTLEWEVFFYLLFGIGLLFRNPRTSFWFPILVLCIFVTLTKGNLIALEFVLGMFCAVLFEKDWVQKNALSIFSIGVILLTLPIFFNFNLDRSIILGIPSFLLVLGAASLVQINSKILIYLGAASYSIYLVQVFTIPAFYKFSGSITPFISNDLLSILCLFSSVIFGCAIYQWFEKPITGLIKQSALARKGKSK